MKRPRGPRGGLGFLIYTLGLCKPHVYCIFSKRPRGLGFYARVRVCVRIFHANEEFTLFKYFLSREENTPRPPRPLGLLSVYAGFKGLGFN